MPDVDLSIVTYAPDFAALREAIRGVAEQAEDFAIDLLIHDNSPKLETTAEIERTLATESAFANVRVERSEDNIGFGRGHNANARRGKAPYFLVLNQDCVLEPGALRILLETATNDDARVAAWEPRQIPYEHPKAYDPVTLDAPWVSGAAALFRRSAFDAVGGFEPRIFMYGEDVDLSWRLRAKGFRLRYLPRCGVVHRAYQFAGEVKPLQILGGVETNLCLRARYGGQRRTIRGLVRLGLEALAPQDFPGRRMGLIRAGLRFLRQWPYFYATRVDPNEHFTPIFSGRDYEVRRDGAFVAMRSQRESPRAAAPLVSILIRTVDRGPWLEQALATVANQTWPNLEAVVIEDGPPRSEAVVERFRDRLNVRYRALGSKVGRARAGNIALVEARGEWLNFLDDDDQLFADHVEVLLDAAQERRVKGAYGLSWETPTRVIDRAGARYEELAHVTRHRHPFDRLALWHHNIFPIQAVLFHRSLYERHGGFAEDMDQLEDWNLWTRYTLEDDFVLVEKTTSKYRVPASAREAAARQALLDRAYRDALERQTALRFVASPQDITRLAQVHVRSQSLPLVSAPAVRRFVAERPWLAQIAAWRGPILRLLRRGRGAL
ncbi:MAG TPA: glycosyltransferase family 2 protein [Casimicrobiaceae bacterium]|nr:glycosyltransferase family 2 protein [Casimicrobiaceae bacterium]